MFLTGFLHLCRYAFPTGCLIVGIAALILTDRAAALKGEDPAHYAVKEIPVMRYRNHDPLEMIKIILQNRQRADIQVVGRLVEQKDVWRAHQDMEQIESAPLAAR